MQLIRPTYIILPVLWGLLVVNAVYAQTAQPQIVVGIAGDVYYATDNDASVVLDERQFATTNIYKDRIGFNTILLYASVTDEYWRTNVSLATYGEGIQPEDANVGLNLFKGLWIEGGLYANWDDDYTFNKWFSENSLTDLRSMASPYLSLGLEYAFNKDIVLGTGIMNSGFNTFAPYYNADNNRSKSFYTKLDWNNLYKDWNLLVSCLTGNEAEYQEARINITEVYAATGGTITDKLEAQASGKFFRDAVDMEDPVNTLTFQTLLRYRFHEKFAAGGRFSFYNENDGAANRTGLNLGAVAEYNPTPFTYLRLESNMLSLSDSRGKDFSKVFHNGSRHISSRLGISLSLGFRFDLWER